MQQTDVATPEWVFDVTARDFDARVAKASVPVLVDFWAPWCGPCQQIAPMLQNLTERYAGRFHVAKVNVDEETTLATGFGVRSIPMLVLFHQGKVVEQVVGLQPEQELVRLIDKYVTRAPNRLRKATQDALMAGDYAQGLELLQQAAAEEPENGAIRVDIARTQAKLGEFEAALASLENLPEDIESSRDVTALRAELTIARDAEALAKNGSPLADALGLAARRDYDPAINALVTLCGGGEPRQSADARDYLLQIFEILGSADERVQRGRRALANLLN